KLLALGQICRSKYLHENISTRISIIFCKLLKYSFPTNFGFSYRIIEFLIVVNNYTTKKTSNDQFYTKISTSLGIIQKLPEFVILHIGFKIPGDSNFEK